MLYSSFLFLKKSHFSVYHFFLVFLSLFLILSFCLLSFLLTSCSLYFCTDYFSHLFSCPSKTFTILDLSTMLHSSFVPIFSHSLNLFTFFQPGRHSPLFSVVSFMVIHQASHSFMHSIKNCTSTTLLSQFFSFSLLPSCFTTCDNFKLHSHLSPFFPTKNPSAFPSFETTACACYIVSCLSKLSRNI